MDPHTRGLHHSESAQRNLAALGPQPLRENRTSADCKLCPKILEGLKQGAGISSRYGVQEQGGIAWVKPTNITDF